MGKFLNILKKYSFGGYKTGLYNDDAITFGSVFSVILSALFLLGISIGIGIYFNEIFIEKKFHITKQESIKLYDD